MKIICVILLCIVAFYIYMHYYNYENFDNKFGFVNSKNLFIMNKIDDKCLFRDPNNNLIMTSCTNTPSAWWNIDNKNRLVNVGNFQCLNRVFDKNGNINIVLQPCNNNNDQFNISDKSELISLSDKKCLHREDNTFQIKSCSDTLNDKWYALEVPPSVKNNVK